MSEPISVALDITPLFGNQTGVGVFTKALASGLANRTDISVTGLLVSMSGRSQLKSLLPAGVNPRVTPVPARLAHKLWQRFDWPAISGFDIVHGTNYVVPPSKKSQELITIHDLTAWKFPELGNEHTKNFPSLVDRALHRGAHIHTVSNAVAEEIKAELKVDPTLVHVVSNGYLQAEVGDPARGLNLAGGKYIFALGTIEPRKDYSTLVEAMSSVWVDHPEVKLVIAGADGWGIEDFNKAVAKFDASNKIVRLGFVNDQQRADLLAGAEMLAYPSLYEGFGLPLLEAMGAHTPVVATDISAIKEVVEDAAILVPTKSAVMLAGAITKVLEDEEVRSRLVTAGLDRVLNYSWDSTVKEMANLYRKIV